MNWLDWLLAALLAYSMVRALLRGFLREAFALGGVVAAFLLACWNYQTVAIRLPYYVHTAFLTPPVAQVLAFVLLVALVMLVATLLGTLLKRTASAVGLGFFDRLLGALFGLARGALLGIVVVLAFTAFLPITRNGQSAMKNSLLVPYFLRAAHAVSFVMPSELRSHLVAGLQQLQDPSGWMVSGLSPHIGD